MRPSSADKIELSDFEDFALHIRDSCCEGFFGAVAFLDVIVGRKAFEATVSFATRRSRAFLWKAGLAMTQNSRSQKWNELRSSNNNKEKRALARFVVRSGIVSHASTVQLGQGSTPLGCLKEWIKAQKRRKVPLDLTVISNSLAYGPVINEAKDELPRLFRNTQFCSTGGIENQSLEANVGRMAAKEVDDVAVCVDVSMQGAFGCEFDSYEIYLYYKFDEELEVQEAQARRRCLHRVFVLDHSKIGACSGHRAELNLVSLMKNCQKCSFVTTRPTSHAERASTFANMRANFERMLMSLAGKIRQATSDLSGLLSENDQKLVSAIYGKELELIEIGLDAKVLARISLTDILSHVETPMSEGNVDASAMTNCGLPKVAQLDESSDLPPDWDLGDTYILKNEAAKV